MWKGLTLCLVAASALLACEEDGIPDLGFKPPTAPTLDGGTVAPAPPIDGGAPDSGPQPDAAPPPIPNTMIGAKPAELTHETAASIAFSSDTAGATFTCSLDGGAFAPCTSPFVTTVAGGVHTFSVTAAVGASADPTPATWTWTVDVTAPNTTITSGPAAHVPNGNATFAFTSTEAGSTFECSVDGAAMAPCTSEWVGSGFAIGAHTFAVRAIDPALNPDATPAAWAWTVDRQDTEGPPVSVSILPLANGTTTSATGKVAYSSTAAGVTFACRTYRQGTAAPALGPCAASPFTLVGFTHGDVVIVDVEGRDAQGDPTLVSRTVTIDGQGPAITITLPAARVATGGTLTFTSPGDVAPTTFSCSVRDPGGATIATGTCTPAAGLPFSIGGSGNYSAVVVGVDGVGNTTTATKPFVVDVDGPATRLSNCRQVLPDDPITCDAATAADAARFQCRVRGLTAFGPCGASLTAVTIPGAAVNTNIVDVHAVDDLGNVGADASATVARVRYSSGDAVLIGHDYLSYTTDSARILTNAFRLSYVSRRGFGRRPKVLFWCSTAACNSTEEESVFKIAEAAGIDRADFKTFFTPPASITDLLAGHDIFVVADQNGGPDVAGIGKTWGDEVIANFAGVGGTLIVLDGLDVQGAPSQNYRFLVGAGALGAATGTVQNGQAILYGDTDAALQTGVTSGYKAPANAVSFLRVDDRWTRSFIINADQQFVVHRTWRTLR